MSSWNRNDSARVCFQAPAVVLGFGCAGCPCVVANYGEVWAPETVQFCVLAALLCAVVFLLAELAFPRRKGD